MCIGLIPIEYCDGVDDILVSDSKNIIIDDKIYHFSVSNKFVKEGFESVLKVLSESLPEINGGLGGAKIGGTVVKSSTNLAPVQKAVL